MTKSIFFWVGWVSLTVSMSFTAAASVNDADLVSVHQQTSQVVSRFGDTVVGGYEKVNSDGTVVQTIDTVSIMIADKSEVAALSQKLNAETQALESTLHNN